MWEKEKDLEGPDSTRAIGFEREPLSVSTPPFDCITIGGFFNP
jgi:hypothetical protein